LRLDNVMENQETSPSRINVLIIHNDKKLLRQVKDYLEPMGYVLLFLLSAHTHIPFLQIAVIIKVIFNSHPLIKYISPQTRPLAASVSGSEVSGRPFIQCIRLRSSGED